MSEQNNHNSITMVSYSRILEEALNKPGELSSCYSIFHEYSPRNRLLAFAQSNNDNKYGPINSFNGWKKLGYKIKQGEHGICLIMPVTYKNENNLEKENVNEESQVITRFILKHHWFFLSQTVLCNQRTVEQKQNEKIFLDNLRNNEQYSLQMAMEKLNILQIPFYEVNGNIQGCAYTHNRIAINPLAENPIKTTLHEMAHICLGHLNNVQNSSEILSHSIAEVEAETTTYIICTILGQKEEQLQNMRGYIQNYYHDMKRQEIEYSSKKIITTVCQILEAMSI